MSKKSRRSIINSLRVSILVLVLMIVVLLGWNRYISYRSQRQQTITKNFAAVASIFTTIGATENSQLITDQTANLPWAVAVDDYYLSVNNSPSLQLITDDTDCASGAMFTRVNQQLMEQIETTLLAAGWVKNDLNTSLAIDHENYSPFTQAYENDRYIALYRANFDCVVNSQWELENNFAHNEFQFIYAQKTDLAASYQEQIAFLRDLELTNVIITQIKREGDWARLTVADDHISWEVVARMINDQWTAVLTAYDLADCQTLIEQQIPVSIMGVCYDEETEETVCLPDSQETVCVDNN